MGIVYILKIYALNLFWCGSVFQHPSLVQIKQSGFTAAPDAGNYFDYFLVLIGDKFGQIARSFKHIPTLYHTGPIVKCFHYIENITENTKNLFCIENF
jgi:hypothetical protein